MTDWLEETLRHAHRRAQSLKALGVDYWGKRMADRPEVPPWDTVKTMSSPIRIIAEFKPASPSAGFLRPGDHLQTRLEAYEKGGAAAVSILTEPHVFRGTMDLVWMAARLVHRPILRKDFIVDPVQIMEAAAAGVSAVLLIHRLLERPLRQTLIRMAEEIGLGILYEVFTVGEALEGLDLGARWIGINNRDLRSLAMDRERALRVYEGVDWPSDVEIVVESGIEKPEDIDRYYRAGLRNFLIGTALMRASDPEALLQKFISVSK